MRKRKDIVGWLQRNGFTRTQAGATGHIHFTHRTGIKVTLRGHGPSDVGDSFLGALRRQLAKAGFDQDVIKYEFTRHRKARTNRAPNKGDKPCLPRHS